LNDRPPRDPAPLPVFPLPDHFVFPGSITPLHIFESRYRRMMQDLMDGPGRLVMAPHDPAAPRGPHGPSLPAIGTRVEIARTRELEDGRWMILLIGLERVALTEMPSDRPYRLVQALPVAEAPVPDAAARELSERLLAALRERAEGEWEALPDAAAVGRLADVLLHTLPLDAARRRLAYAECDPAARAGLALTWHEAASVE